MLNIRINTIKLEKTLQKSIMFAEQTAGKIVENSLRNIVTGKKAKGLSESSGLYQLALQNAPTKQEIEGKVKKLKSAFILLNGRKVKTRLNPKKAEDLIIDRVKTIGHTARTLLYSGWNEAVAGRNASISQDVGKGHSVSIKTTGKKHSARFESVHGGISHMMATDGVVGSAAAEVRAKIKKYAKKVFTEDLRRVFK